MVKPEFSHLGGEVDRRRRYGFAEQDAQMDRCRDENSGTRRGGEMSVYVSGVEQSFGLQYQTVLKCQHQ